MARGSTRGGGFRSGGFRSGGRSQSSAGRSGRGGSSRPQRQPKGQIKRGKVVQYAIRDESGQTKYIGSTNNPTRRAAEHREGGKMRSGDKLEVQSQPISRRKAEQLESGRLKEHRRTHGDNPQHNTANDGQYHPRRR